jgi:DNA-binding response OmpR family regulator
MATSMTLLAGLSVLLVEDEFLIALDAEQILKELGVQHVEIAATFKDAETRATEGDFDLAVLDINLNGELSLSIARLLRDRGIPVVFASGYELRSQPLSGFENDIYITKPYTGERLEKALAAALGRPH